MDVAELLNITVRGQADAPAMVFAHGFGCGQQMWRHVAPAFEDDHRVVLFDLPGAGDADPASYDPVRHASLDGYADDVVGMLRALELRDVTLVGHSVSAMIAVLAHLSAPEVVTRLVLVNPSARYLDDEGYAGGFSETDIEDLLALMDRNHLGWQDPLSGMVSGPGAPEVKQELEDNFCRTRPEIAAQFAAVTFRGDNRADLPRVTAPTLVLQASDDVVAPVSAGTYIRDHVAGAELVIVETTGHCAHLSAPQATVDAMRQFLAAH
jgi:sigma-B regulation protein RsbQ